MHTDWFDVKCGLRQGCILSPILFNLCMNDLVQYLKSFGKGVKCNDDYYYSPTLKKWGYTGFGLSVIP